MLAYNKSNMNSQPCDCTFIIHLMLQFVKSFLKNIIRIMISGRSSPLTLTNPLLYAIISPKPTARLPSPIRSALGQAVCRPRASEAVPFGTLLGSRACVCPTLGSFGVTVCRRCGLASAVSINAHTPDGCRGGGVAVRFKAPARSFAVTGSAEHPQHTKNRINGTHPSARKNGGIPPC